MTDPFLTFGKKTYIMGILNITPDSFSGDGLLSQKDVIKAALNQALQFIDAGADILDIGGESTRPGAEPVSAAEEMDRVLPVIETLAQNHVNAIFSIDTYKAGVARAAIRSGAQWINDIWGLHADAEMAGVAARTGAPLILMHNRSKPTQIDLKERLGGSYLGSHYKNLIEDVKNELLESVALAQSADVKKEHIILDPGLGFGKTVEQNLELVNRLDEIKALGFPILLGPSRKSFIGYTLDLPPDLRMEGTAAVCAIGIVRGADILRVHDVQAMARVARMSDALVRIPPKKS